MSGEEELQEPLSTVDESAIRRNAMTKGMWDGMRKGALYGGMALVGLLGAGAFLGVAALSGIMALPGMLGAGGSGVGSVAGLFFGPGGMAAGGVIGGIVGGVLGVVGAGAAIIMGTASLPTMLTVAAIGLGIVGVGAAIGAAVGAVNGYNSGDDAVLLAHDAEHMSHERKQMSELQMQQKEKHIALAEAKILMEKERLARGGSLAGVSSHGLPPQATAQVLPPLPNNGKWQIP